MFVEKEYRGNGFQFQMLGVLEKHCKEITTAEPNNVYSSSNMEKAGYENNGYKLLERGPRNIYVRTL